MNFAIHAPSTKSPMVGVHVDTQNVGIIEYVNLNHYGKTHIPLDTIVEIVEIVETLDIEKGHIYLHMKMFTLQFQLTNCPFNDDINHIKSYKII